MKRSFVSILLFSSLFLHSYNESVNDTDRNSNKQEPVVDPPFNDKPLDLFNIAHTDCGAKLVESHTSVKNADTLIKGKGYLMAQSSENIWFVIKLCKPSMIQSILIGNTELFSAIPQKMAISISNDQEHWTQIGTLVIDEKRSVQRYEINSDMIATYLKFEILEVYGNENLVIISSLEVYGSVNSLSDQTGDKKVDDSLVKTADVFYPVAKQDSDSENKVSSQSFSSKLFEISEHVKRVTKGLAELAKNFEFTRKSCQAQIDVSKKQANSIDYLLGRMNELDETVKNLQKRIWFIEMFTIIASAVICISFYRFLHQMTKIQYETREILIGKLNEISEKFEQKKIEELETVKDEN